MNNNMTKGHLKILRTNYEDACNSSFANKRLVS